MKTCSKCNLELHLEQFNKYKKSKDGHRPQCKACDKIYRKENKQKISEQNKKYREDHKQKISEQNKKYREEHKQKISEYGKKYNEEHREEKREYSKKYSEENKEKIREQQKKYREENKEVIKIRNKKYNKENKEKISEQQKKYIKNRRKTDEGYRILDNLRRRLNLALKGANKSASTMELVGCSIEFLQEYLEKTKVEGKDYSDAHIDHIRPCASFDLTVPEQQMECFHYTNLQLLPAKENISKGAKLVF